MNIKPSINKFLFFFIPDLFLNIKICVAGAKQQDFEYLEWINTDLVEIAKEFVDKNRLVESNFVRTLNETFATNRFEIFLKRWIVEYLHRLFGVLHFYTTGQPLAKSLPLEDNPLNRFAVKKFYARFRQQPLIRWTASWRWPVVDGVFMAALILWLSLKNGLKFSRGRRKFKVLREGLWGLYDVRGQYFHDDFFVDNDLIHREDLLLFSRGGKLESGRLKAYEDARRSEYRHFNLQRLSISTRVFVKRILPKYIRAGSRALRGGDSEQGSLWASVFFYFLKYAVPYERIFSHFEVAAELGHNYFSANHIAEAIVCQTYGTRYYLMHWSDNSIGIDKYLLSFLGCDEFLLWGKAHIQGVEGRSEILRPIGYVFKKFIKKVMAKRDQVLAEMNVNPQGKIIAFFDESFGGECKMTERHYVNFWKTILETAVLEPGHTIVVKPKEFARHKELSEPAQQEFLSIHKELSQRENVFILDSLKWSFIEAIGVSDLVVTQGMTSSATIAIIAGIPGLYLDEAHYQHQFTKFFKGKIVFDNVRDLIARIDEGLKDLSRILSVVPEEMIRCFDAYPDDEGVSRLRQILAGQTVSTGPQQKRSSRVGIIVQARMGSTRLPGKIMKPLLGRTMLEVLIERLRRCSKVDTLIVATTTAPQDDQVEELCRRMPVECFRGSEEDVLSRYYEAAKKNQLDVVVRITSDCPLMDPNLIDQLVEFYFAQPTADIVSNTVVRTFPRGFDMEVFSFKALEKAFKEARETYHREHVTPFFYEHFKSQNFSLDKDSSQFRVTVDTPEDYTLIRQLFELLKENKNVGVHEVIALLEARPDLVAINRAVVQKPVLGGNPGGKVAIVTEGGRGIGFGHATRCLSIARQLKRKGVRLRFIVNEDAALKDVLHGEDIRTYALGPAAVVEILKEVEGFDFVLVDSYLLNEHNYQKIFSAVRHCAYLDDNQRIVYPPGIVVNGSIYASNLSYPHEPGRSYLLGPKFIPLREEFVEVKPRVVKERVQKILVTFGGDDAQKMTAKVRDFLLAEYTDVSLDIVIGKAFRNYDDLKRQTTARVTYHHDITVEKILDLMNSADLAISAGGQTLHELARTGTPTIGICVADNQLRNLKGWQNQSFLKFAGCYNDAGLVPAIKHILAAIEPKSIRERMAHQGQTASDGRGSERIAQKIMEVLV